MKICYIGNTAPGTTSYQRALALQRMGHEVSILDPYIALSQFLTGVVKSRLHYHSGYKLIQPAVNAFVDANRATIGDSDVAWVDSGELLGAAAIRKIREGGPPTVLFNADDPTGGRDGARFDSLLTALPHYDLCATVRDVTQMEMIRRGARTIKVWRGCDEIVHAPATADELAASRYDSGIVFVGTWMRGENRDWILASLVRAGLPVSIWGDRWHRSRHWATLRPAWKGASLRDRNYTLALASADACLGFLSSGNRDQHTGRSLEAPYAGCVLLAERTPEHLEMYQEGREALFWSSAAECREKCEYILSHPEDRNSIRIAARRRALALHVSNECVLQHILTELRAIK